MKVGDVVQFNKTFTITRAEGSLLAIRINDDIDELRLAIHESHLSKIKDIQPQKIGSTLPSFSPGHEPSPSKTRQGDPVWYLEIKAESKTWIPAYIVKFVDATKFQPGHVLVATYKGDVVLTFHDSLSFSSERPTCRK